MKQILQNLKTGVTELAEVPCPQVRPGQLLIRTACSLISSGTERMLVDFGKAGFVGKVRQQPDKIKMVLDKVYTDGLIPTLGAVRNKLDQPLPLGYCNVGRVVEIGRGVEHFTIGDRVASNGKHAEMVGVPVNLCARIPDEVSDENAAFTVIGGIALQGIRLVQPTLGETVVVTGLGLIGQMTVQLLRAHGCRVLGIDFDRSRIEMAKLFGTEVVNLGAGEDPILAADRFSRGRGVDAVIITAATKSSEPIHQAALMCRQRGRIVLVGVTGLEISRDDFFKKELTFQVSASYGPGRYDKNYEERGQDYPFGFVRWTEQRNFEAVLDMLADGRLDVGPLVSHRFPLEQTENAYKIVGGGEPSMGILLEYPTRTRKPDVVLQESSVPITAQPLPLSSKIEGEKAAVGFIGSGNYATAVLIPAFKAAGARLVSIASTTGVNGVHAAKKYGFEKTTTDTPGLLIDPHINAVVITTRHDNHASLVCEALQAGKYVFVEKPLCLTLEELDNIRAVYLPLNSQSSGIPVLMIGFNRRFAPQIQKIKKLLAGVTGPKLFLMTVNAGAIPADHWIQDPVVGGGRIIGEACHFIDLLRYLSGHAITQHSIAEIAGGAGDTVTIQLGFADGSIGTVHYLANGSKSFPKERLEVFAGGRILQLDNFRKLKGYGWPGFKKMNLLMQDKGQRACAAAFVKVIREGGAAPIAAEEIFEVSKVTIELAGK